MVAGVWSGGIVSFCLKGVSMTIQHNNAEQDNFSQLSVEDCFTLNLYAGVYHLLGYIYRLSGFGGDKLEKYFDRYPFLKHYFTELSHYMPGKINWQDGCDWWQDKITELEDRQPDFLPLKSLRVEMNLSFSQRMVLILAGLVEEDSRFGTLFSQLQQPLGYRRPMLETLGQIVVKQSASSGSSPWDICGPLLKNGLLVSENAHMPRSEWILKIYPLVWELIRGGQYTDDAIHGEFKPIDTLQDINDFVMEQDFIEHLQGIPVLIQTHQVRIIILRAMPGSNSVDALGTIARALGKNLLLIRDVISHEAQKNAAFASIYTILDAMPVFVYDLAPGETMTIPKIHEFNGALGIIMGHEGGLKDIDSQQVLTINMPNPGPALRERLWQQYLAPGWQLAEPQKIAGQFRVPGDYIRQLAHISQKHAVLARGQMIDQEAVQLASRNLNRQLLDELADPLEAKGNWQQLITVDTTAEKLIELQQRCSYREQLLTELGQGFKNSSNCGVRALFTGRSGTGKTLAAKILASEAGMDIYRVDLASIVNKYIGETEKNLHKVLTRAEALDVILLLDEGDALLGSRTEVKNANDRYANLETNYLLQRLEHYQGIVLITTNLADNIDKAFQRRMDIVVPFYQPQMEQRLAIFYLHLPDNHYVEHDYLEKVSRHCNLMGGQIRNICLHTSLLALDEQDSVRNRHLELALRSEYRKNGGTFPLDEISTRPHCDGGMGSFVNALVQSR